MTGERPPPSNLKDTSVIVLAWNDIDDTTACISSIRSTAPECEIILVDNGSDPPWDSLLQALAASANCVYIRRATNGGYGCGMNAGLKLVRRPYTVCSNNDVLYEPHSLRRLVASLDDRRVGAAVPYLVDMHGRYSGGRNPLPSVGRGLARLLLIDRLMPVREGWSWRQGAVVAMRTDLMASLGGFSEASFMYSEDLRLCWELANHGLRTVEVGNSVVAHRDDASAARRWSPSGIASEQVEQYVRASRELLGGWRGWAYVHLYYWSAWLRRLLAPSETRRVILSAARRGMK